MTTFAGSINVNVLRVAQYETQNLSRRYRLDIFPPAFTLDMFDFGYSTPWWPCQSGFVGSQGDDVSVLALLDDDFRMEVVAGAVTLFGIVGVTRDYAGGILGSTTVKLFLTSTDQLVHTLTSDPTTGQYTALTPYYPLAHYLVCYKTGSPDVFGTSPNTLIAG